MRSFLFGLGGGMLSLGASDAPARNATFYTVTYVEVVPPAAAQGADILRQYRDASRQDEGAVRFEVLQRLERPNQFTVPAAWTDQQAFQAHTATGHLRQLNERLAPLLAAPNDTREHHGLALGNATAARDGTVTAVTHVDVIPPEKDNGVAALTRLAQDSRSHEGNLRFEVWQQTNRPNHFTVVETWADRAAFDAHAMAAQTKEFRTKLATMTGALYDERLYSTLG